MIHRIIPESEPPQPRPVLTRRDKLVLGALGIIWMLLTIVFWTWWFQPEHVVTWPRLIITTIAIAYDLTVMPLIFLFFISKMKQPEPVPPPAGLRVAMVTAIVPSSESLDVLERTLGAMSQVRYPHDNWVLDEGGDEEVRRLCERYGAHYWTRKGKPEFNQPDWPFQARTKSGNYNSWFSDVAYERYEYLVQLDTDHAPEPEYLDEVLGYFSDPKIAYVALPSVYWNLDDWTTRGSSEQGQVFQGPIQMGYYGWAGTPMIIGSHAAYRVEHLREIGGFAQSRAEDHLDTLKLAQAGYRGVFVPKNLASGLGPHNIFDYLVQEHQWAFSIAQVLFQYGRRTLALPFRQRVVFLFSELWYSWFSRTYLLLFLLPMIALVTNKPLVEVPLPEFLLFSVPITWTAIAILGWCYWRGWFRPGTHFFLSWQGPLLIMARWPIVLVALANAVISVVFRGGRFSYMVTPKGRRAVRLGDVLRIMFPYLALAAVALGITLYYVFVTAPAATQPRADGYVMFALMSAALFTSIIILALRDYYLTNRRIGMGRASLLARSLPLTGTVVVLAATLGLAMTANLDRTVDAVTYWPGVFTEIDGGDDRADEANGLQLTSTPELQATSTVAATPSPVATATISPVPEPEVSSWLFDLDRTGATFGAYDPQGELNAFSNLEHIFIAWSDNDDGGVPVDNLQSNYADGRPVLLSVEPWPVQGMSEASLLDDISTGRYDDIIEQVASSISSIDEPILFRFGHEMDITGLYPWSGRDPDQYIAAYQHVVDEFRDQDVTNVIWVWSPGGTLEALDYYPGDDYVDYIGTTILEYTAWELEAGYTTPRRITRLVEEKYELLEELGKPIILAEVGVALDPEYKTLRLEELMNTIEDFPLVRAIVYFNSRNPENPVSVDRPDWSLTEEQVELIRNAIESDSWFEN